MFANLVLAAHGRTDRVVGRPEIAEADFGLVHALAPGEELELTEGVVKELIEAAVKDQRTIAKKIG